MKNACVIYARVSSDRQEQEGFSIPAQLAFLREYASKNGLAVAQEFLEVASARKAGRPKFNEMLALVAASRGPKIILVEKTDRLYRNAKDGLVIDELVKTCGVAVHFVRERQVLDHEATPTFTLMHNIDRAIAQLYSDNLSLEVKKGMKQKLLSGGYPFKAPYGYLNDRNTRTIQIDESKAPWVRQAFKLYASGMFSIDRLGSELKKMGLCYAPATPKPTTSQLHKILTNPTYIGRVPYKGEVYEGSHAPLIDVQTFEAVQRQIKRAVKPLEYGTREFTYRGFLRCGDCGHVMTGEEKKQGRFVYYHCSFRKCSNYRQFINEKTIDNVVVDAFKAATIPTKYKPQIVNALEASLAKNENAYDEQFSRLSSELSKLRTKRKKLAHQRLDDDIDQAVWAEVSKDIESQIIELEAALARLNKIEAKSVATIMDVFELPQRLARVWSSAELVEKIQILTLVCSNLTATGKEASIELVAPFEVNRRPIIIRDGGPRCMLFELPERELASNIGKLWPELRELGDRLGTLVA